MSRIEQGTVTAGDVADRFETDENGNEWAVINGQRVSPDAVITGAAVPVDSNGQPAGQPIYEIVMAESITEPTSAELSAMFGSDEPLYEGSITLSELNPDWDFGAGTAEDNQKYIGPTIKQLFQALYHTQPTDEQVNNLTLIVTAYALNAPAEDYGNNLANLCQNVVQAYGTGDLTSNPLSGLVPVHVLMNSLEQQTNTSQPQTPVPSNSQQTANSGNNASTTSSVPPVPDYNYGAINPYGTFSSEAEAAASANTSAEALKKAQDKINEITAETLKDKYEKYKKQIEAATRGLNKDSQQYKTKQLFVTLIEELKKIVNSNKSNMTAADKKKLVAEVSKKVTELLKGKISYEWSEPFNNTTGGNAASLQTVCSQYTTLITNIMGATQHSNAKHSTGAYRWASGHNAWYYLPDIYQYNQKYKNATAAMRKADIYEGVTSLANNTTVLNKNTDITRTKIVEWMQNPTKYKDKLDSLIGTMFFSRPGNVPNRREYPVYQHTGMIVGYEIINNKATLIIDDSTMSQDRSRNGLEVSRYDLGYLSPDPRTRKLPPTFDIYEINY